MKLERYLPPAFDDAKDVARLKDVFALSTMGAKKAKEPEPPPPPTFTEAELEEARKDGQRKGFLEGEAEGKKFADSQLAQLDRKIEAMLTPLAGQIYAMMKHYNTFISEAREFAPHVAHAVAKKIAGDALKSDALPLVDKLASDCVATMLGEPKITITVSQEIAERFEAKIAERFASSNEPGEVTIHGDASLAPTDCRVEWANGQARISQAERLKQIDNWVEELAAGQRFAHKDFSPDFIPNQGEQP